MRKRINFTLIEFPVVMAITAIIAAMAMRLPDITREKSARKTFLGSLGFAEGRKAAPALGECDSRRCEAGELESRHLYLLLNLFSEPSRNIMLRLRGA